MEKRTRLEEVCEVVSLILNPDILVLNEYGEVIHIQLDDEKSIFVKREDVSDEEALNGLLFLKSINSCIDNIGDVKYTGINLTSDILDSVMFKEITYEKRKQIIKEIKKNKSFIISIKGYEFEKDIVLNKIEYLKDIDDIINIKKVKMFKRCDYTI